MTRKVVLTSQFKRDIKKRYLDLVSESWAVILQCLVTDNELPTKYKDHPLISDWAGCRDCHIKPDLILIYEKRNNDLILHRMGSHSELF